MSGSYMLVAFILGFWCIWSANRDVNAVGEALGFTLMAIVIKALMEWKGMPNFDSATLAAWGLLFVYTVVILELVERFSTSMVMNMTISVCGAVGWFFLAQYAFSEAGMASLGSLLS